MADDAMLREMGCDPKFRKVLVTDGKTAVGQALVKALVKAGADLIWVGHAEPWKKLPGLDDITALPQVTLVPLDLTNERSVSELAGAIAGKVDIVINNAEVHRTQGVASRRGTDVARAEMDINYFGALRLAQEFGPALKGRAADGQSNAIAWVNLLSIYALEQLPAARHLLGVEGRGAFAGAVPARRDAAGRHPRDQRLPGPDRRRVEPAACRRRRSRRRRWPRPSSRRCATASRTCIRATWRRSGWRAGATTPRCSSANWRPGAARAESDDAAANDVLLLATWRLAALAGGQIRVIDLTQTLTPEFPQIALPPELGQCWPFRIEEVSKYDERGPGWYWNNFSCGEHTGTHFDAPIHWISGRDLPNNSVDTIPGAALRRAGRGHRLLGAGAGRPGPPADGGRARALWEQTHGRIPAGAWVLMRTDWSKRSDPEAYQNFDETGQHTPGPEAEVARFLVEQRDVLGFGSEAIGTDAGQGYHLRPPYPCHYYMHGAGRYGLQCLSNLDLLPPTGAMLICPPLKIQKGSGSPLRVLALVAAS